MSRTMIIQRETHCLILRLVEKQRKLERKYITQSISYVCWHQNHIIPTLSASPNAFFALLSLAPTSPSRGIHIGLRQLLMLLHQKRQRTLPDKIKRPFRYLKKYKIQNHPTNKYRLCSRGVFVCRKLTTKNVA